MPPIASRSQKPERLVPLPKNFREVPGYLKTVLGGFFSRLFYIVKLVWETSPALMLLMMVFCILNGVLPVVGALITSELLNAISALLAQEGLIVEDNIFSSLTGTLSVVVTLIVMQFAYQFLRRILNRLSNTVDSLAGEMVVNHIKLKLMDKAKRIDLASFDRPEFYEKLENANREAGRRPISILLATFNMISTIISMASFVVILLQIGWIAPVLVLGLSLPTAIVNYHFRNKNFWYNRRRSIDRRKMDYFSGLVTNKDMVKELRIMGLSDTFIEKYNENFGKYYKGIKKLILQEGFWQIVAALLSLIADGILFFYVAYHVIAGGMQIGDYSLYTGALTTIASSISTIISSTATIYEGTLFIDNMMTFMKEKTTVVPTLDTPRVPQRHVPHTIELRDVSFRYPGTERDVIRHMSVTLHPGERVVLVGLNGAGKTTLIKLLTRLYDPTEGVILLDGHDIREYSLDALYDMYGILFQDFGRYAVSVAENIEFGDVRTPCTEERVHTAAREGDASDFIEALPDGYDTPLMRWFEENGVELSGGQWQKLSVARAFYKDSDILILDEPTASLDALAEQEIFDRFAELAEGKISIFVSHRLSSATTADRILVIEYGELIEYGTHEELMALKGKYFKLFSTQACRYTGINYEEEDPTAPKPPAPIYGAPHHDEAD